ncbi:MAG: Septum formation initiator [Pedosphaera sp.]|nr:Septum formation initiator [Pedosphaera sp.]
MVRMKVDLGIWGKLTRVVIFLLLLAGFIVVALWYTPLIQHNERLGRERLRLDTQVKQEEETAKRLRASLDAVQHDPKTVERLAREKLGYAKAGETVIRFEEPATNSSVVQH